MIARAVLDTRDLRLARTELPIARSIAILVGWVAILVACAFLVVDLTQPNHPRPWARSPVLGFRLLNDLAYMSLGTWLVRTIRPWKVAMLGLLTLFVFFVDAIF